MSPSIRLSDIEDAEKAEDLAKVTAVDAASKTQQASLPESHNPLQSPIIYNQLEAVPSCLMIQFAFAGLFLLSLLLVFGDYIYGPILCAITVTTWLIASVIIIVGRGVGSLLMQIHNQTKALREQTEIREQV